MNRRIKFSYQAPDDSATICSISFKTILTIFIQHFHRKDHSEKKISPCFDAPLSRIHLTTAQLQTFSINLRSKSQNRAGHRIITIWMILGPNPLALLWVLLAAWSCDMNTRYEALWLEVGTDSATERTSSKHEGKIPWEGFPYHSFFV